MKLHSKVLGSGRPVLILHGLFGSLDNWHSIGARLAESFRVYGVDLRNHGRSPHSPEMNYPLMAEDLRELISAGNLEKVSLIGHSMGGKVAMQFALSFQEQVEKLVVVDIAPRAYPPSHETIFKALLSLNLAQFKTRQQIQEALAADIPDVAVRQFLLKNLSRQAGGGFFWQNNLSAIHENYSHLIAGVEPGKTCDRPALFLRGEKSDYIRAEDEPLIRQLFPRAEVRTLVGADHWVHADVPETFLRNVQEFLRD